MYNRRMNRLRRHVLPLTTALVAALALGACGGGTTGGDDDPTGDGGGSGDAPPGIDAVPGPDAQPTLTVSGQAQTVSGTSTVALAGATIEAYGPGGGAPLATTTSAGDGAYALTLTTNGAPIDGYLKGTSATRLDTYLYPPRPLASDQANASMLIITQQTLELLHSLSGASQMANKGFLGVVVLDENSQPAEGATVTVSPMGTATIRYTNNGIPDANRTSTGAGATVYILNAELGQVTIDAQRGTTDFFAHAVEVRAGVVTTTAVQP